MIAVAVADEEAGLQEPDDLKGPIPGLYVLPHTETAMLMDITPENAVEVCPHIPEIITDRGHGGSQCPDEASSSGSSGSSSQQ